MVIFTAQMSTLVSTLSIHATLFKPYDLSRFFAVFAVDKTGCNAKITALLPEPRFATPRRT
jgi:hypothetical protein